MKVAIVHDWLVTYAGAERVLEQLALLFPEADLYAIVDFLPPDQRGFIQGRPVNTSFVQRLPFARRRFRRYLFWMPLAVEQFDLSGYDLVISSSHAVAKGVLTGPNQLHISYIHSPMRYAWDLQHHYLRESGLARGPRSWAARWMLHRMRLWDTRTANGVDVFVANSNFIARRIRKTYGRESIIIYPPVDADSFVPDGGREDFYLTASRLVPYKRVDLIVEAFSAMPQRRLVVIGDGPEHRKIRFRASSNVTLLGHQPTDVLRGYMQRARAFVFAAEEDFGIAPLEAQACGTPVLAYDRGGVCETIHGLDAGHPTGVLFSEQTVGSLANAVQDFEAQSHRISPLACRQNALRFSRERFLEQFSRLVQAAWTRFHQQNEDVRTARAPALHERRA